MAIIDASYFTGEILIANRSQYEVQEHIDFMITKYENQILDKLLGIQFSNDFKAGLLLDPIPEKWLKLRDGTIYNNNTMRWNGFANDEKQSIIANYVYYWLTRDNISQTTGIGEVRSTGENSNLFIPVYKQVRAWNEMVDWIADLNRFIALNNADYPYFHDLHCCHFQCHEFRRINSLNI